MGGRNCGDGEVYKGGSLYKGDGGGTHGKEEQVSETDYKDG